MNGRDAIRVVAYRGDWRDAPENSVQSVKDAIALGVDMVEIDLSMTRDSVVVVMHDATIDRTEASRVDYGKGDQDLDQCVMGQSECRP
jgi:glycerophosphoryl diester phosphodiesterase